MAFVRSAFDRHASRRSVTEIFNVKIRTCGNLQPKGKSSKKAVRFVEVLAVRFFKRLSQLNRRWWFWGGGNFAAST